MTIRVQYSTTHAWQSAVIRRMTHSPFSHVDILDADGNCIGASDSPDAPVIRGNPRGVAVRPSNYQDFAIRRVAEIDASPESENKFYELLYSQLGKPFDGAALYAFLSPDVSTERDWRATDSWFCAEYFIWAAEQGPLFPYTLLVSKNRVAPSDSLLMINGIVKNIDTFWNPVSGYVLGPSER